MDAGDGLLRIPSVSFIFGFAVLFGDCQDAQTGDGFERVRGLCVNHPDTHVDVVRAEDESKRRQDGGQDAFRENWCGSQDGIGGADGIRIHRLYRNKGVLRCSLAF